MYNLRHVVILILFVNMSFAQIDVIWRKQIDVKDSLFFKCETICKTFDGGFAIFALTLNSKIYEYNKLIKLNYNGEKIWSNDLDVQIYLNGCSLIASPDSGYYVFGGYLTLEKLNKEGELEWRQFYFTNWPDWGHPLYPYNAYISQVSYREISENKGFILSLFSIYSTPIVHRQDGILLRLNSEGDVSWVEQQYNNKIYAVVELDSEKFVYVDEDRQLKMIDEYQNIVWQKEFDGSGPYSLKRTSDNNFIFKQLGFLTKMDGDGDIIWKIDHDSTGKLYVDPKDNVLMLSSTSMVHKYDRNGILKWNEKLLDNSGIEFTDIIATDDNCFIACGDSNTVIKFTDNEPTAIKNEQQTIACSYKLSQNYPNPFNPLTKIAFSLPKSEHVLIEVYNSIGQKLKTLIDKEHPSGNYTVTFDGKDLSSGVYLYSLKTATYFEVKKMVLIK